MTQEDSKKDLFKKYVAYDRASDKDKNLEPDPSLLALFQQHLFDLIGSGATIEEINKIIVPEKDSTQKMDKLLKKLDERSTSTEESWILFSGLSPSEQAASACLMLNIKPEMLAQMLK